MKKLLVLVFAAAMCVPSYGDILVYKITWNFNTWIGFTDDSYAEAVVGVNAVAGYEVLDIDMETGELNTVPTLIFYSGKSSSKWCWSADADDDTDFYGFDIRGTTARGINGYTIFSDDTGFWYCYVYGKSTLADIGRLDKRKVYIPKSLKGVVIVLSGGTAPVNAFGNMIMTLDSKYTKTANNAEIDQWDTTDRIIADLEAKGYVYQE